MIFEIGKEHKKNASVAEVNNKLVISFDNGNTFVLDGEKIKLEVPISECDIEVFKEVVLDDFTENWSFPDQNGNMVDISFVSEDKFIEKDNKEK